MSFNIAIKQWYKKHKKLFRGYFNSQHHTPVSVNWWDELFYSEGIRSDASTISKYTSEVVSAYHYSAIQLIILQCFHNKKVKIEGASVLDVGSGSGHWIDFYQKLGARQVTGIESSEKAFRYLKNRFGDDAEIIHGKAVDIRCDKNAFDVVSAIGVMFHIVDDDECAQTIKLISSSVRRGGVFIIGGHFGYLNGLNVQIGGGVVNKRLRSRFWWKRQLKECGFSRVEIFNNKAYLKLDWLTPEANILVAIK